MCIAILGIYQQGKAQFYLDTGAQFYIQPDTKVYVASNLINNTVIQGKGCIVLNGQQPQTVVGTGSLYNLIIDNPNGITIASGTNKQRIIGTLIPVSGILTTNGNIVLQSDSNGTARIAAGSSSGGYINGTLTAEKYIPGGGLASNVPSKRAYRFISHPFINSIALNQLSGNNEIDITGPGGTSNGFSTNTGSNAASAFWYNTITGNGSSVNDVTGWKAFEQANSQSISNPNSWKKYQGIRVFVRGGIGQGLDGNPNYFVGSPTITIDGQVNTGDQIIPLQYGGANWNFVGNPFPSPVNLSKTQRSNVSNMVYVWRLDIGSRGGYSVAIDLATSDYILPAYGAFFVQATSTNPIMNFRESDKDSAATDNSLFRNQKKIDKLKLQLKDSSETILWDETLIEFDSVYRSSYNPKSDGLKIFNTEASLYSLSKDSIKLSLDRRRVDTASILLGIKSNISRQYRLIISETPAGLTKQDLWLHDKYLDYWKKLEQGGVYTFSVTSDSFSQGNQRLEIVSKPIETIICPQSYSLKVSPNPATEIVQIQAGILNSSNNTIVNIFQSNGIKIASYNEGKISNLNRMVQVASWSKGAYMVQIINGDTVATTKFIKL